MEESKPHVQASSSLSGFLSIRAPPTRDSDSDVSEINGHDELYYSTSSNISGSDSSEALVTGEEFETASERPFVADPDEDKYEFFGEDNDDIDDAMSERIMMPVAQLSWESDDNDEVGSEEGFSDAEDGEVSGRVKVPSNGFVGKTSIAPRVRVFEVEDEEEEDDDDDEESMKGVEGIECLNSNKVRNGGNAKYVEEEVFVDCPSGERHGVDSGLEGNENEFLDPTAHSMSSPIEQNLYLENCDLSEFTKDEEVENAICSDLLESITLSSLSVNLLCENMVENGGVVQFLGDTAYGAKAEVPFKEQEPRVMVVEEGEECRSVPRKESLVDKQYELAIEVKCVKDLELNNFVEGQVGECIQDQAERMTDNGLRAAEINEPNSAALKTNVREGGEKSIVHCPNIKRDAIDASGPERGMHSGTDFGVEGNEDQIRDSNKCSQPNPIQETVYLGNGDWCEATKCDRLEYALCSDFLKLITPSSNMAHKHTFRSKTRVENFNINGTAAGATVTLSDDNVVTGLKIDDQLAIGKRLVLARSAGALQFEGDTAHGAKLEVCLNGEDFPVRQNQTSLGLSLMKWGGGLVLTADVLSQFSVGGSKMAVHVVLDNKQRGQIAIRTSSSNQLQSALVGIISIAVSIFGIFRPKSGVQKAT